MTGDWSDIKPAITEAKKQAYEEIKLTMEVK